MFRSAKPTETPAALSSPKLRLKNYSDFIENNYKTGYNSHINFELYTDLSSLITSPIPIHPLRSEKRYPHDYRTVFCNP